MEFLDWEDAKRSSEDLGLTVIGTYRPDGVPVYTLCQPEADDEDCHETAFELRHGRRISGAEQFYMKLGKHLADHD